MAFLDFFKTTETSKSSLNDLHQELKEIFKEHDDDFLAKVACVTGLLAKIAHIDFEVTEEEKEAIATSLKTFSEFNEEDIDLIVSLALVRMKKMQGLHTSDYCSPLNTLMTTPQRFSVLKMLFFIAASDKNVDNHEVEAIRNICKGLILEQKHFIAAKASVKEHLGALK